MPTDNYMILAVIDPTKNDQWALRRALMIAKERGDTEVTAFLCVHSGAKHDDERDFRNAEVKRHTGWFDDILSQLDTQGVKVQTLIEWDADWVEALERVAGQLRPNLVVKRSSSRPGSLISSDRRLVRNLGHNLLLIRRDPSLATKIVLGAANFNAKDETHVALNNAVTGMSKSISDDYPDAELHLVCAFHGAEEFVDPQSLAKPLGIDRSHVHVRRGNAEEVIPERANMINADLVVIGNAGRHGLSAFVSSNTSEKILGSISSDVIVIVAEPEQVSSAA